MSEARKLFSLKSAVTIPLEVGGVIKVTEVTLRGYGLMLLDNERRYSGSVVKAYEKNGTAIEFTYNGAPYLHLSASNVLGISDAEK